MFEFVCCNDREKEMKAGWAGGWERVSEWEVGNESGIIC